MRYVISISNVDDQKFYFAGWEGSDTEPMAGQLTYWRKTISDPETYEYDDDLEAVIESKLIVNSKLEFPIGIPDSFKTDIAIVRVEEVRVGSYGH